MTRSTHGWRGMLREGGREGGREGEREGGREGGPKCQDWTKDTRDTDWVLKWVLVRIAAFCYAS